MYILLTWYLILPITVAARSRAWTVFARSNTGVVGSYPPQHMDIRVCLYCLCCPVVEALRRADPPSKESYRLCIGSRNWKSGQGPTKGCRIIESEERCLTFGPFCTCHLILRRSKRIFYHYMNINELNGTENGQRSCLNDIQITDSPRRKQIPFSWNGDPDPKYICLWNC
jgi:hypothetical protein